MTCNWIRECVEHRAEGPTVKDSAGHFILRKGAAACAFAVMCIRDSLLITVASHHDDVEQVCTSLCSLCHWYIVMEQLLSLVFMTQHASA